MDSVRKPKPIGKVTMGCDCGAGLKDAKCPGCEYEFKVKKDVAEMECPNCEQEFSIEEFIAFYHEAN